MFNKIKSQTEGEVLQMNIGSNIAALRKAKGITQEELAKKLGVSAQAVSKWENSSSCPDVSLLTNIADFFNISVDALLRLEEQEITQETKEESTEKDWDSQKKYISINIVQQNGKENNIKLPFKFVKLGLNIGSMFGLSKEISNNVFELIKNDITDIVEIDTENGEHISIGIINNCV